MIDSHCHLTDRRYPDIREIIAAMPGDGLEAVVTVGYDNASSAAAVKLAGENERVYAAVGLHPTELTHNTDIDSLIALAKNKKVAAYGEIGLDYYWDKPERIIQKKYFEMQIEVAILLSLPIIVHSRDCDGDMLPILKRFAGKIKNGLVMHCFSSSAEIAREYGDLDFYISFAGPVTYKNAKRGDAVRAVADNRLLAETDCPYLTPMPHRGKLNYPAYVRYVIEKLAEHRGTDFTAMEKLTSDNAKRLFGIGEIR